MDAFETSLNKVKESNKKLETNQVELRQDFRSLTDKVNSLEEKLKVSENKCEQLEA